MKDQTESDEKRTVFVGASTLDRQMTRDQAKRYGDSNMSADLKEIGFETIIFVSDPVIHDGSFFRINYGMKLSRHKTLYAVS